MQNTDLEEEILADESGDEVIESPSARPHQDIARITIVGRPNVGKSSLFNVLSGHKIAIVSETENTTRDIVEYQIRDEERHISYILADSGGITEGSDDEVLSDIRARVLESVGRSELILFVLEYDKITALDEEIARLLRRTGKPVILIANKADNRLRALEAYELLSLGFEDMIVASASHGVGLSEIRDTIAKTLRKGGYDYEEENYSDEYLKLAIIGRPNVGKSSIVNAITGTNRAMVRDMPGTTRDSLDTIVEWEGQKMVLIDTAGIRRAGKIGSANIEQWSVLRSERAITRADVVAVVVDADEGITAGDKHIVERALEEKKGIILIFNKWDKILARPNVQEMEKKTQDGGKLPDKKAASKLKDTGRAPKVSETDERFSGSVIMNRYFEYIKQEFDFLAYVTPLFTSAVDGKRIESILEVACRIREERRKRVRTAVFNDFLEQIVYQHAPTGNKKSHKPKVFYGSQVDINPPKFVISVNNTGHFHFSYPRYIENRIREFFGFQGTPIILELKWRESIFKKWGGGLKDERNLDGRVVERPEDEKPKTERKLDRRGSWQKRKEY